MKRTAAIVVSFIMTMSCGSTAFAAVIDHDIDSDDLEVSSDNYNADGYRVYSSSGTKSSHKIVINGVTTTITLDHVDIEAVGDSAIDIGDDANVNLVINGENNLTVTGTNDAAGIHVSGGTLTISGTDADDDTLTVTSSENGAAIGSDGIDYHSSGTGEAFTGTIVIDRGVTVNADSIYAAAIGSGDKGEMSGDITVNGGTVNANSEWASGIGSGIYGDMSGDITINGGTVNSTCVHDGSGIGSGFFGEMDGNITINGGDVTAKTESYGSGIGSGAWKNMSGTITINGGNVIAEAGKDGAAIGEGGRNVTSVIYDMSGQIIINGGNVTATSGTGEVGIGAGIGNIASGDITIHGDAVITLGNNNAIGAKKESEGTIYLYKGAEINGTTVTNVEDLKDTGILNDNMEVVLLEEETSQGHSYSLGKLTTTSRIKSAKAGDKVYIYESELSKGKVPYYVLETLSKADNVTLVLVCENGETVEINSANVPEKGKKAFFTVDELMDMAK